MSHLPELTDKCAELAGLLARDLESENLHARVLTIKLKTVDFDVRTRAMTLPKYIHKQADILKYALQLLQAELPVSLRLMGLRMNSLASRNQEHGIERFIKTDANPDKLAAAAAAVEEEPLVDASCPVCGRPLGRITNTALNRHVDLCLNNSALFESVKKRPSSDSSSSSSPAPKRQAVTPSSTALSSASSPDGPSSNQRGTLLDFFVKRGASDHALL